MLLVKQTNICTHYKNKNKKLKKFEKVVENQAFTFLQTLTCLTYLQNPSKQVLVQNLDRMFLVSRPP